MLMWLRGLLRGHWEHIAHTHTVQGAHEAGDVREDLKIQYQILVSLSPHIESN